MGASGFKNVSMNPPSTFRPASLLALSLLSSAVAQVPAGLLKNGDMSAGESLPADWQTRWVGSGKIALARDLSVFRSPPASLRVYALDGSAKGQYYQTVPVSPGQSLVASGWIKCEGADTTAQLGLQFYDTDHKPVGFSQLRYVTGDVDWSLGSAVVTVPDGASRVAFLILLDGDGQAWLDDAQLRFADAGVLPTQAITPAAQSETAGPSTAALVGEGTLIALIADFRKQTFSYGYGAWKDLAAATRRGAEGLGIQAAASGGAGIVYPSPASIDGATHIRLRCILHGGQTADVLQLKLLGSPEITLATSLAGLPTGSAQTLYLPLPATRPARVNQVQFQGGFTPGHEFNLTLLDAAFVRRN